MADQADRRAVERMPAGQGVACGFAGLVTDALGGTKLRDISLDGVGLLLGKKVEVGAVLAVTLTNPAKGFVKTILVRVAHVTAVPGGFLAGGTFDTPLTYPELTTLVL